VRERDQALASIGESFDRELQIINYAYWVAAPKVLETTIYSGIAFLVSF